MNRREFFEHRARLDFERRQGVTVCPPAAAADHDVTAQSRHTRAAKHTATMRRVGQVIVHHPLDDEDGSAIPVRGGGHT